MKTYSEINEMSQGQLYCYLYDEYEKCSCDATEYFSRMKFIGFHKRNKVFLNKLNKAINDIYANEAFINSQF